MGTIINVIQLKGLGFIPLAQLLLRQQTNSSKHHSTSSPACPVQTRRAQSPSQPKYLEHDAQGAVPAVLPMTMHLRQKAINNRLGGGGGMRSGGGRQE